MPDDFRETFPYGLSDLPLEPPDDPNALYPSADFLSIGRQRGAGAQFVPAQFRLPRPHQAPVGPYPAPAWPAPGPAPEIPIPDWWKKWGPALGAAVQILPRITSGSFGGGDPNGPGCKEEWDEERAFCAQELAKPYPNRRMTGGHKNIDDCARGRISEPCGGNRKADGYRQRKNPNKKGPG